MFWQLLLMASGRRWWQADFFFVDERIRNGKTQERRKNVENWKSFSFQELKVFDKWRFLLLMLLLALFLLFMWNTLTQTQTQQEVYISGGVKAGLYFFALSRLLHFAIFRFYYAAVAAIESLLLLNTMEQNKQCCWWLVSAFDWLSKS